MPITLFRIGSKIGAERLPPDNHPGNFLVRPILAIFESTINQVR